jgi:hypothetical protein
MANQSTAPCFVSTAPCFVSRLPDDAWLADLVCAAEPLVAVPHAGIFQLQHGEEIRVPAAAVAPSFIASLLQAVGSIDASSTVIAALSSRLARQRHVNDACLAAFEALFVKSTVSELLQPWLLLVVMTTPVEHAAERDRIVPLLALLSQQRRLQSAAIRVTAKLLCDPVSVRLYLGHPYFPWRHIYGQSNVRFVLDNLGSLLSACLNEATRSPLLLRAEDVAGIIRRLAAPPASPTAVTVLPASTPSTAALLLGPADSIPQVTEQLLPVAAVASGGHSDNVVRCQQRRDSSAAAVRRRSTRRRRRDDPEEEYVVRDVVDMKVVRGELQTRVAWEECDDAEDTWLPWAHVCQLEATRDWVTRLVQGEDRAAQEREIARLKKKVERLQAHTADLGLQLRALDRERSIQQ